MEAKAEVTTMRGEDRAVRERGNEFENDLRAMDAAMNARFAIKWKMNEVYEDITTGNEVTRRCSGNDEQGKERGIQRRKTRYKNDGKRGSRRCRDLNVTGRIEVYEDRVTRAEIKLQ
jgi:hypothetical protein